MHKLVTTDNAFIDARLNYETYRKIHCCIFISIGKTCRINWWMITDESSFSHLQHEAVQDKWTT